ncbi:MAG: alpha/beta fold hydrolase [Deltaproteobacteria bacterium]|nr:alpha/beta fold hydrolase [Deltaproteobacteria bacterium]
MQSTARHPVIAAADGLPLAATVFEPAHGPVHATLLVLPAMATRRSFYRHFAAGGARRGVRVATFDYRGVGDSRPGSLRGFRASLDDWAGLDAVGAHDFARRLAADGPLFVVGHSFGGQVLALADALSDVDGAVLVGAQLGYYGHWPAREQRRLWAIWKGIVPVTTFTWGYAPGWLGLGGVDLPADVARQWARWCASPGYLFDHVAGAKERARSFDRPALVYSFTDDDFAPARAVASYLSAFPRAKLHHARLAPSDVRARRIGHFGYFRPESEARLWAPTFDWILARAAGLDARPVFADAGRSFGDGIRIHADEVMADLEHGRDAA